MALARRHKIAGSVALVAILAIPFATGVLVYLDSTAIKMAAYKTVTNSMTLAEVTAVLGPPSHTETIASGERAVLWYATDGVIGVSFDSKGRVESVSAVPGDRLATEQRQLGF